MGSLFTRILLNNPRYTAITLSLFLVCITFASMSVPAEAATLNLQGKDMAPAILYTGDAHEELLNIVMLQLSLNSTDTEGVNLNSITVHRTGVASDTIIEGISLYEDENQNGELDLGVDILLSNRDFHLGKATFSVDLNITTNPVLLLIVLDISDDTRSGSTIGIDIPYEDRINTAEPSDIEFEFPICSKNSTILLDTDGDSNPDETDPDDDNDEYTDEIEEFSGTDSKDANSVPKDTDKDLVPDSMDTDDDNDGVPDKYDDFPLDSDRQRDYTIVIIYTVITVIIVIILLFFRFRRRAPKYVGKEAPLEPEEEMEEEEELGEDWEEEIEKELEEDISEDS